MRPYTSSKGLRMSHEKDIQKWKEYCKEKGWRYPSPLDWFISKLGREFAPSFFWPAWLHGSISGLIFGLIWGLFMYFTEWSDYGFNRIAIPSLGVGILFGLTLGILHSWQRRKLAVKNWNDFLSNTQKN